MGVTRSTSPFLARGWGAAQTPGPGFSLYSAVGEGVGSLGTWQGMTGDMGDRPRVNSVGVCLHLLYLGLATDRAFTLCAPSAPSMQPIHW